MISTIVSPKSLRKAFSKAWNLKPRGVSIGLNCLSKICLEMFGGCHLAAERQVWQHLHIDFWRLLAGEFG